MNFVSGNKLRILQSSIILLFNSSSLTSSMTQLGKTPFNKLLNKVISSLTNLGIKVLHTLLNKIFCSQVSIGISFPFPVFSLSLSSLLFKLPALTKTLFKALKPKS